MTPKEKAKELVDRYKFMEIANYTSMFEVKQCALVAVDEILEIDLPILEEEADAFYYYWQQVKHELNKSE